MGRLIQLIHQPLLLSGAAVPFQQMMLQKKVGCDLEEQMGPWKKTKANLCNPQGDFMHVEAMAVIYLESGLPKCC